MVDLLKLAGHEVISLPSPIGATKAIINSGINVVVLDVVMPSLRGDKLALLLGKNPRLRHVGVVLVTGAPTTEIASMASKVGAASIVQKSSLHMELEQAVRRAGHVEQ
jgi:DNA-binding NtrC family response regulator